MSLLPIREKDLIPAQDRVVPLDSCPASFATSIKSVPDQAGIRSR
jgi:hypothetical protein